MSEFLVIRCFFPYFFFTFALLYTGLSCTNNKNTKSKANEEVTSKWRRINVDKIIFRRYNVSATSLLRHVSAGGLLLILKFDNAIVNTFRGNNSAILIFISSFSGDQHLKERICFHRNFFFFLEKWIQFL